MAGPLSRWIFSRIVKSALVFEQESIGTYRRLQESLGGDRACGGPLADSLCHLLEEERQHWDILSRASEGKLEIEELEKVLDGHMYAAMGEIRPLSGADLERWGAELSRARESEEKTWVFYTNLRRMSKIPAVRRAFDVLAHMEKEHIDILRALLGEGSAAAGGRAGGPAP